MNRINLNIFIPTSINFKNDQKIEGYCVEAAENTYRFYISEKCRFKGNENITSACYNHSCFQEENVLYGEIHTNHSPCYDTTLHKNYLALKKHNNKIITSCIKIGNEDFDIDEDIQNCAIIFYDYDEFLKSEDLFLQERVKCNHGSSLCDLNQFHVLKNFISNDRHECQISDVPDIFHNFCNNKLFNFILWIITYLSTFSNLFFNILHMLKFVYWGTLSIFKKKKVTVKVGNLILALLFDFACGLIILNWNNQWYPPFVNKLFEILDITIPNLKKLLKWLMGSPAGLKPNHAFNNMLGKFFFYHINLWSIFLEIFRDVLEILIEIIQYLGMLGITFQAAVLADLLSLASVHFYCIYIYAARLYNIQLRVLISLSRLFIGRKHNPLRAIVDSCHYTHNQLFIGTLGFTILLFLLPTTFLYYAAFTIFRLMQLMLSRLLVWTQFIVRSLPLYSLGLWLIKSPKITNDIQVSLLSNFDNETKPTVMSVRLRAPSLMNLIKIYIPDPIPVPEKINGSELLSNVLRGKRF